MQKLKAITVAPLPVTLQEIKQQLVLDVNDSSEDSFLTAKAYAATVMLQGFTGLQFMQQQYKLFLDTAQSVIAINDKWPIVAINAVHYKDANGDLQELAAENYRTDLLADPVKIEITEMPGVRCEGYNNWVVTFTAGYGEETASEEQQRAAIPTPLLDAVKLRFTALYEQREDKKTNPNMVRVSEEMASMYKRNYT